MSLCERCETLPEIPGEGGFDNDQKQVLYLWPPMGHSSAKIAAALKSRKEAGAPSLAPFSGGVAVTVDGTPLPRLLSVLKEGLTSQERGDTRCLVKIDGREPGPSDFAAVMSLDALIGLSESRWLVEVIREGRLTTHFQPIIAPKTPDRVYAHECLLRWTDEAGTLQPPGPLFDAARGADLLFQLDRTARETAVRNASRHGITEGLFINFTPSSIYDPANCLQTTLKVINELDIPRRNIVFEVVETEKVADADHLRSILAFYRENGFRVALDDLGAGFASLGLLQELRPDIVKIDRDLISGIGGDRFKQSVVGHIIDLSHDVGIKVVAEGVETREEAVWLGDHGADLLQGFLFGRPAAAPVTEPIDPFT